MRAGWLALLFVAAAWLLSLPLTAGLAAGPPRWLSGHTLMTLWGYGHWGLLPTLGANLVLPAGPETLGVDLRGLGKLEGAYLTYPSAWSLALYLPWVVARTLGVAPEAFLQGAGLLGVRLAGGLFAGLLLRELGRILLGDAAATWRVTAPAALAAAGWMLAPAVLVWSQADLFADQFILAPVAGATWLALRARFRLAAQGPREAWALGLLGALAVGTEWLGWTLAAVLAAGFAIRSWAEQPGATPEARAGALLRAGWCLWAPQAVVAVGYLAQLSWFTSGWPELLTSFHMRALSRTGDGGTALTWGLILAQVGEHWRWDLPGLMADGLAGWATAARAGQGPPWQGLLGLAWLAGGLGAAVACWRQAPDRRLAGLALGAIALPPLLHTGVLLQHATIHAFSGLKLALPLAALCWALPVWAVRGRGRSAALVVVVLAGLLLAGLPGTAARLAPLAPPQGRFLADLATVVREEVGPTGIPVSTSFPYDTMRAHACWAVGRLVYAPEGLGAIAPQLAPATLAGMSPVVLVFADEAAASPFAKVAAGRWQPARSRIEGREVWVARFPEARGRIQAWLDAGPLADARGTEPPPSAPRP